MSAAAAVAAVAAVVVAVERGALWCADEDFLEVVEYYSKQGGELSLDCVEGLFRRRRGLKDRHGI